MVTKAERSALAQALELQSQKMLAEMPDGGEVQEDMFAGMSLLGDLAVDGARVKRAGPGRPRGSINKSTKEMAEFILARYRSPLIGLAEIVNTPVPLLAQQLGCTRLEALGEWRQCAKALAEYIHQKMPTAIEVDEKVAGAIMVLNAGGLPQEQAETVARSAFGLDIGSPLEDVEFQEVSGSDDEPSNAETVEQPSKSEQDQEVR